jgi:hypothetical protein
MFSGPYNHYITYDSGKSSKLRHFIVFILKSFKGLKETEDDIERYSIIIVLSFCFLSSDCFKMRLTVTDNIETTNFIQSNPLKMK